MTRYTWGTSPMLVPVARRQSMRPRPTPAAQPQHGGYPISHYPPITRCALGWSQGSNRPKTGRRVTLRRDPEPVNSGAGRERSRPVAARLVSRTIEAKCVRPGCGRRRWPWGRAACCPAQAAEVAARRSRLAGPGLAPDRRSRCKDWRWYRSCRSHRRRYPSGIAGYRPGRSGGRDGHPPRHL